MQPSNSPIVNVAGGPPICPECGREMRVVPQRHIKGKIRTFLLFCDNCEYGCEHQVQYINIQFAKYQKPAAIESEVTDAKG